MKLMDLGAVNDLDLELDKVLNQINEVKENGNYAISVGEDGLCGDWEPLEAAMLRVLHNERKRILGELRELGVQA